MHKFCYSYKCSCGNKITLHGTWEILCSENELETIRICIDDHSFNIILGTSSVVGDFLCIPSHDVGCAIRSLSDTLSITEHLIKHFNYKDSAAIAAALKSMCQHGTAEHEY